ncbi:unnamed protein product [Camellia sinensis]
MTGKAPLEEMHKKIWLVDSKKPWAPEHEPVKDLLDAVKAIKPTVLIGSSGVERTFTKEEIEAMASFNDNPLIMALSNPTSQSECTDEEAYTWSQGHAIFASGSPVDPMEYNSKVFVPGQVQANNAYIFPGFSLGLVISGAIRVHDEMLLAAWRFVGRTFTKEVIEVMASFNEKPLIMGHAIFASGSPFDPVEYNGKLYLPGQANNAYIFPRFGLGLVISSAIRVHDEMLLAALEGSRIGGSLREKKKILPVTLPIFLDKAGKGGELTHDETTIIAGALGLTEKIASDAMTPISDTFAVDINAKLDRELMNLILEKGHRRVPVYYEQPTNIIGLVLSELENLSFLYSNAQDYAKAKRRVAELYKKHEKELIERYVLKSENLKNGSSCYCTECVGFANGNFDHLCWIYEIFVGQSPLQGSAETSFFHIDSSHDLGVIFHVHGFRPSILKFPRYFGSSGVSGAIPSTFAALRNLQTVTVFKGNRCDETNLRKHSSSAQRRKVQHENIGGSLDSRKLCSTREDVHNFADISNEGHL